ncbi:MAG: hypothetical protein FWC45_10105, partial [Treponema sp.]|nr:hypothetical protein [Treponema sp.]
TGIAGPGGLFGVLYYREDLPRYWERLPRTGMAGGTKDREGAGNFSLQWDEEGSLVRISYRTASPGTFESPVEYRYDYTLDERGNWIERREIRMIRRLGLLVPLPGITFTRVLEYR